ncbi:histidine kinase [Paenibacillus sp. DMB20]|nr:histidine kinase [Paenibacillus sp. DMB20]
MSIHLLKLVFVPFISLFIMLSSVTLGKGANLPLMAGSALLLFVSVIADKKYPWIKALQFLILGVFQYASHLNWCILLYYILTINVIQHKSKLGQMMPYALLMISEYSLIRFTFTPFNMYTVLVAVFDILSSIVIIFMFHIIVRIETEKKTLFKQNKYLINHDPLTGFLNYDGYMRAVRGLADSPGSFQLILLDINNFKSLNAKDIATANEILISFSISIRNHFTNMLAAARYAGDRFAVLLPSTEPFKDLRSFDDLGLRVTYSITHYPQEASTFQEVISMAEERIFQMRRESWLKSQEEFMRSAKMKTVGELAAGMAHEIRNPLTAIKGFIQLSKLQNYNIEPWYEVIMGEITRVGELTAEFLQFSKPHMSNMKVDSLIGCMTRVFSLCESEAASRGHTFTMELPEQQVMVFMDRDKMIQVLINLIRNAFQAMETTGNVHFSLSLEQQAAMIRVEDTGKGIAKSEIGQIFDPFYTTKEDGTGLGLSLCQKIVEDHGGTISVHSEFGVGTIFTVKLPVAEEEV